MARAAWRRVKKCGLMRLSWNEVRARAAKFANDWQDAAYEKGETQSFYNEFFEVFGKRRREVARYEQHVSKLNNRSGFIDLFWPRVLIVEQKSAGRDLKAAYEQAGEYFDALPELARPRYILVSDFQTFELHDLDERESIAFSLADLPANIEAAELVGRLHDSLADAGHGGTIWNGSSCASCSACSPTTPGCSSRATSFSISLRHEPARTEPISARG